MYKSILELFLNMIICSGAKLKLAKSNIDKFFSVVGYLENYEKFLTVLEELFPTAFGQVTNTYIRDSEYHFHKSNMHLMLVCFFFFNQSQQKL